MTTTPSTTGGATAEEFLAQWATDNPVTHRTQTSLRRRAARLAYESAHDAFIDVLAGMAAELAAQMWPQAATVVYAQQTEDDYGNEFDEIVCRVLLVRNAAGAVIWHNRKHADGHPDVTQTHRQTRRDADSLAALRGLLEEITEVDPHRLATNSTADRAFCNHTDHLRNPQQLTVTR